MTDKYGDAYKDGFYDGFQMARRILTEKIETQNSKKCTLCNQDWSISDLVYVCDNCNSGKTKKT